MWKTPSNLSFGDEGLSRPMTIAPIFPNSCQTRLIPADSDTFNTRVTRWRLDCDDRGLTGQTITFPKLNENFVEVLVRMQWTDGRSQTTMLSMGESSFTVPTKATVVTVGKTYLKLGIEHIFSGVDHLLFVLGLVLIVGISWRLLKTITAFTVAHSITLSAATLGFVRVPQTPVEAVIALSILFLAVELANSRRGETETGLTEKYPWLIAAIFGLLHGFGFAGALSEVGLPAQDIPAALLFFNVGVEFGQLVFVLGVLAVIWGGQQFIETQRLRWLGWISIYGIGIMSSFWCIERIVAFWRIG
jgi:hydrogenase/urease accessory protein HupE